MTANLSDPRDKTWFVWPDARSMYHMVWGHELKRGTIGRGPFGPRLTALVREAERKAARHRQMKMSHSLQQALGYLD